ncbi:MAG: HAD hydrolase-like protein [Verrucomicrobiota bacterium]|nr:HAD hydrolase-like protein [Verrucomicrobiota bacterium]MEE2615388.1 HAD hydrolase-like protein [Verrucomicrobiota bacterium]
MIRNIIFDWSGTLVDDLPGVWKATNHVLEQAGVQTLTLNEFRSEFELPFTKFYDRFIPDTPLSQLEKWFHGYFEQVSGDVNALPNTIEFLEFCKQKNIRCFILSTVKAEYFLTQAKNTKMEMFFEKTYLGIWDKREKIRDILTDNNLSQEETIYVGDMQHDVDTAHHGGIHSCALLTGYNTFDQLKKSKPTLITEDLSGLKNVLETNQMSITTGNSQQALPAPIATVGALIYNSQNQILMIKTDKWSGKWGIPGGKIEYGEASESALRREIAEETNLTISNIKFVLSQDSIQSDEFFKPAHFILLNYTCTTTEESNIELNEEAQEYCWTNEKEALQLELNKPTRVLIETILSQEAISAHE